MGMTRRAFARATLVGGAGIAATSLAAAPARTRAQEAEADEDAPEGSTDAGAQEYACDICVVGAGFSGMIAAVQACELGADVLLVEADEAVGGSARNGIEGSFGVGSDMAEEAGITVDVNAILLDEMEQSQWRADGVAWTSMMQNSGDNINWLVEQGVRFETVDDYHGKDYATFHWYEGGASQGYVEPMAAKVDELGIPVLLSTKATTAVQDEAGRVCGIEAQGPDGKVSVSAKAVILATGGFAANDELRAGMGYPKEGVLCIGLPTNDGSGHDLATAAGAKSTISSACDNGGAIISSWGWGLDDMFFCLNPVIPWINESCERFFKEDNCAVNYSLQCPPRFNQAHTYMVFDQAMVDDFAASQGYDVQETLDGLVASGAQDICKAESLEELPATFGLDADAFAAFVTEYNGYCESGEDAEWRKDPQYLKPLSTAPYYIAEGGWFQAVTIGSIATDHSSRAINEDKEPIEGLYVVGVEGCMLYRNVYTIGTPGSCSGSCINSARVAARHAVENCL